MDKMQALKQKFESYKPANIEPVYNFFVYGLPGSGKTTLVRTLKKDAVDKKKKVLLLNNDYGDKSILSAIHDDKPYQWLIPHDVNNFDEIRDVYRFLKESDHSFGWVVLDDATIMAEMLLKKLQQPEEYGDDTWGAYGQLETQFKGLLRAFRGLDLNVLFLGREDKNREPVTAAFPGKALGGGNNGSSVLHEFDHAFRATRVSHKDEDDEFFLQTKASEEVEAKRQDEFNVLKFMEEPDISAIKEKLIQSVRDNVNKGAK